METSLIFVDKLYAWHFAGMVETNKQSELHLHLHIYHASST